jgi:hypothetical protein
VISTKDCKGNDKENDRRCGMMLIHQQTLWDQGKPRSARRAQDVCAEAQHCSLLQLQAGQHTWQLCKCGAAQLWVADV